MLSTNNDYSLSWNRYQVCHPQPDISTLLRETSKIHRLNTPVKKGVQMSYSHAEWWLTMLTYACSYNSMVVEEGRSMFIKPCISQVSIMHPGYFLLAIVSKINHNFGNPSNHLSCHQMCFCFCLLDMCFRSYHVWMKFWVGFARS